jgi:hypothetical protein
LRRKCGILEDSDFGITNKKEIKNMAEFVKNGKKNNKNNNTRTSTKTKDFGSKKESIVTPPDVCAGIFEYKMPKAMAENILKADKSRRPAQEILCEYVNTQNGLKGFCVKVIVN